MYFDDSIWQPLAGATLHADTDYITGTDGTVSISIDHDATIIPAISIEVSPESINLGGGLGPRDVSEPVRLTVANTGARDLHDWDLRMFTPANIGFFPEPFLHGYGEKVYPTYIIYESDFEEEPGLMEEKFLELGVKQVSVCPVDQLTQTARESGNLIIIEMWVFT